MSRVDQPRGPRLGLALGLAVVLLLGFGLRTAQYLGEVDLWHDEIALARNVEDRGLAELVSRPLDHQQVAPVGFMALIDVAYQVIDDPEWGLRFVPWLFGLAAVFLFWRVARRFARGYALLAVLGLFAVSPALILYGSSVKPYGSDLTLSLLLALLALRFLDEPGSTRRGVAAGVVGAAAMLVSFPVVPTAAVLGAVLLLVHLRADPRPPPRPLAVLGGCWVLGAVVAGWIATSLVEPSTDAFMRGFWAEDFPPLQPWVALVWIPRRLYEVFAHSLIFIPADNPVLAFIVGLPLALAVVGLVAAWRAGDARALILIAPVVAAVAAAVVRLLPFDGRLALHATWPVLVLAGVGITAWERGARGRVRLVPRVLAGVMVIPLTAIVLLAARPPFVEDGIPPRTVLTELQERLEPGDQIYVYSQGRHDMAFYGRRAGIEEWIRGDRHNGDPRGLLREVDQLRGSPRVWFFWVRLDGIGPSLIRDYLGTIGHELAAIPPGEPAVVGAFIASGAILYDLSDPERLEAASAASFEITEGR